MFYKVSFKPEFKKELTWIELKGVQTFLQEVFPFDVSDKFGIPYTSSGQYAMLGNTNSLYKIEEGINLDGFAVTENSIVIAIGSDADDNESYYRVEEED